MEFFHNCLSKYGDKLIFAENPLVNGEEYYLASTDKLSDIELLKVRDEGNDMENLKGKQVLFYNMEDTLMVQLVLNNKSYNMKNS